MIGMRNLIIMPVLDEGEGIAAALDALADLRAAQRSSSTRSHDATIQRTDGADRVISARGRACR
jgi:hypothetical protein